MLFLHKGSNSNIYHAVYSDSRPKTNQSDYELISHNKAGRVRNNVALLAPKLGIQSAAIPGLIGLLNDWLKYTPHDEKQGANIYKMMSARGMQERQMAKLPAEWRFYNNYVDLVLALNGDMLSRENLAHEKRLADEVLKSLYIKMNVVILAKKVSGYIEEHYEGDKDELIKGSYKTLHASCDTWDKWLSIQSDVDQIDIIISCLHDISKAFKALAGWNEPAMKKGRITKVNMRMNVSTPNEDSNWTASARWANVPIWAAPSYTAHLMLEMARMSGGDRNELQSLAYGIYAYWSCIYPETATPVHRLYGVMTAAYEFGIPEKACNPDTMYIECKRFISTMKSRL